MNYIVLDLEWNQAFTPKMMVKKPVLLRGEIVQIGAVKLDENYRILDTFKIMVTPKHYTKMHKKVTKITRITTEELQYGFPFPVAMKHFQKWCGEEFTFLTWGPEDVEIFRSNMMLHHLDTEWLPKAYDLQIIFDSQITNENRQVSLLDAMEQVGEPALVAHDALNDARNTVAVCVHLNMEKGLEEYESLEQQMHAARTDAKENSLITKTYASREEALKDPEVIQFFCPTCGENVTCEGFVQQNSDKYICIGKCENGEELFVRLRFRKQLDERFKVSRIIYEMDEENRAYYLHKKEQKEEAQATFLQESAMVS